MKPSVQLSPIAIAGQLRPGIHIKRVKSDLASIQIGIELSWDHTDPAANARAGKEVALLLRKLLTRKELDEFLPRLKEQWQKVLREKRT